MKQGLRYWMREVGDFGRAWKRVLFWRGYKWFARFEAVKDVVARSMYRQRGRFARPYIHLGMVAVTAVAATLAPVVAQTFPGAVAGAQEEAQTPSEVIAEVTDDGTTTQISDKYRDKIEEYTVKTGDTLASIAKDWAVDVDTIKWENNLAGDAIKPGLKLRILPVSGIAHKVGRGETIYSIAKKYQAEPQAMVDFPFNTFSDDETFALDVGQILIVPDGKKPEEAPKAPPVFIAKTPGGGVVGTGRLAWPVSGVITQRYSGYHPAIDVANPGLPDVFAADSGVVVHSGWSTAGYGNMIMIDHRNGYMTLYGHFSKLYVQVGQEVTRGQAIGREGSTGRSTGPHVHFEVRQGHSRLNPLNFLQ